MNVQEVEVEKEGLHASEATHEKLWQATEWQSGPHYKSFSVEFHSKHRPAIRGSARESSADPFVFP